MLYIRSKKFKEAITMRAELKEYQAVEAAAMKFVKSVAEGNSAYAKNFLLMRLFYSAIWTGNWSMALLSSSITMEDGW
jgi:hypothetical protein